jgi:hypothetical protein
VIDDEFPPIRRRTSRGFVLRDVDGLLGAVNAAVQRARAKAPLGVHVSRESWVRSVLLRECARVAGPRRPR